MIIRLSFDDVDSKEENSMRKFIVGLMDSIIAGDIIKICISMVNDVYENYEDQLNCTDKKKFQDIIKLLNRLDERVEEK